MSANVDVLYSTQIHIVFTLSVANYPQANTVQQHHSFLLEVEQPQASVVLQMK